MKKISFIVATVSVLCFVPISVFAADITTHGILQADQQNLMVMNEPPGGGGLGLSEPVSAFKLLQYFFTADEGAVVKDGVIQFTDPAKAQTYASKADIHDQYVVLDATKNRITYALAAKPEETFYFDGSLTSWRFLQKKVLGTSFKDPFTDRDYNVFSARPKKVYKNCQSSLTCYQSAVLACRPATYTETITRAGLPTTMNLWEVWGKDTKGSCVTYRRIKISPDAIPTNFFEILNTNLSGRDMVCVQKPKDVVAALKSPDKNTIKYPYAPNELNPYANCRGTLALIAGFEKTKEIPFPKMSR